MVQLKRKELVQELIQFMNQKRKKTVLLVEYIQETSAIIHWTKPRIWILYGAVHETNSLFLDYCYRKSGENEGLYVQVCCKKTITEKEK